MQELCRLAGNGALASGILMQSLGAKLLVVVLPVAALALAAVATLGARAAGQQSRETRAAQVRETTRRFAEQLNAQIEADRSVALSVATSSCLALC